MWITTTFARAERTREEAGRRNSFFVRYTLLRSENERDVKGRDVKVESCVLCSIIDFSAYRTTQ